MIAYERTEIVRLLELEETFIERLEGEAIVHVDVGDRGFSPRMVERIRVAHSLVYELDVNLSGVAVILRMREELGSMHGVLGRVRAILRERGITTDEVDPSEDERRGE